MTDKAQSKINRHLQQMNEQLNRDYEVLNDLIRDYITTNQINVQQSSGLQWVLARMHTDMVKLHETVKTAQEILR